VVHRLRARGYEPVEVLEQDYVERLSGVRLARKGSDVIVDLLFASSGKLLDALRIWPLNVFPSGTRGLVIASAALIGYRDQLVSTGQGEQESVEPRDCIRERVDVSQVPLA
jgi:hypothetical protein